MSSQSSSAGSKALLNLAVGAAGVLTFVNMWCTQAILPILASSFHVTPARTGLCVTAPLVATAMMAPAIGAISDRFGRKRFICGAALLLLFPSVAGALTHDFNSFILYRFIQGLMLPFIFTVTIAYIGDESTGATTVKLAGTYTSGAILGGFSGRFITGLVTSGWGWRPAFFVIAALTFALAVLVCFILPRERNFRPVYGLRGALHSFPLHLANPRLLGTYGVGFGMLFCLVAIFTFINFRLAAPPYLLGPAALGGIFVVYLGGVVMSPLAARLANTFGRPRVMLAVAPCMALGLVLTLCAPLWAIALGLLLAASGLFVQQTLATGFIGIAAREAKSTAVGLYVTSYYIGGSAGGFVPAGIWHAYGWPGCIAIIAFMQAIMLGLALKFWKTKPAAAVQAAF
jgi:YNFM family putative membrane transporter